MFPCGEVLAADFCIIIVYFWYSTIVLDGILSILTDVDNGSTQQVDVRHVPNLDQILTVGSLRRGGPRLGSVSKSLRYPLKVVGRVRDRLQSQSRCMSACDSVLTNVILLLLVQQEHLEVGRVLQNHSKQLILVDFEQTADFKARQIPQTTFNDKCQPTAVWFHVSTQHPRP